MVIITVMVLDEQKRQDVERHINNICEPWRGAHAADLEVSIVIVISVRDHEPAKHDEEAQQLEVDDRVDVLVRDDEQYTPHREAFRKVLDHVHETSVLAPKVYLPDVHLSIEYMHGSLHGKKRKVKFNYFGIFFF
jgi:hypothetical protein